MIITVTSYKGGVGKTTTAVHLACYIHKQKGKVLLVDGDPNRSCLAWSRRGQLPFSVVDEKAAMKHVSSYEHVVIDTAAKPEQEELSALSEGCDLLILPTTPDAMSLDALSLTVSTLKSIGVSKYRVLLTILPPKPIPDGEEARAMLQETELPLFKQGSDALLRFKEQPSKGCLCMKSKTGKRRLLGKIT